jgi:hypothetical protein
LTGEVDEKTYKDFKNNEQSLYEQSCDNLEVISFDKIEKFIKNILKRSNMKNVLLSLFFVFSLALITGCNKKIYELNKAEESTNTKNDLNDKEEVKMSNIKIFINDKEYEISLEDNETVKSLVKLLPLEITMNELNRNEKYVYLNTSLPTNSQKPKHINSGDVMLYGNDCLVVFYKSFDTSYSYTRIGHINNLPDLGSDSINVRILEG